MRLPIQNPVTACSSSVLQQYKRNKRYTHNDNPLTYNTSTSKMGMTRSCFHNKNWQSLALTEVFTERRWINTAWGLWCNDIRTSTALLAKESMFFLATWSLCFRKDHASQVTGVATLEVRLSGINHCHLWPIKTQKKYYVGAMMCLSIYNCIHSRLNQSHKQRKWCFCGNVALFYF